MYYVFYFCTSTFFFNPLLELNEQITNDGHLLDDPCTNSSKEMIPRMSTNPKSLFTRVILTRRTIKWGGLLLPSPINFSGRCKISTCELNLLIGCVLICFDLQKINASTGKNYLVKLRCRSIVTVIRTGWFHKMTQLCTQYIFATSIRNLRIQCTKSRQSLEESSTLKGS